MSKRIDVTFKDKDLGSDDSFSYDIIIADGFRELDVLLEPVLNEGRKAALFSDDRVYGIYGPQIELILEKSGVAFQSFVFPAGEESKNLDTVREAYEFLIKNRFERRDVCIALGGGVVGDLTGFTAATYLRGIPFIQIPTTLLAQTDSSIGGKTGVDLKAYKNMVGSFHQPLLCFMNTETLKTLDRRQFLSGLGEVIKSALIKDKDFYEWIKKHFKEINALDETTLEEMIYRACLIKREVVQSDPTEKGERALLNFGHTLGHAIEKCAGFSLYHGECVVLGMTAALHICMERGYVTKEEFDDVYDLFKSFGYTLTVSGLSKDDILETVKSDKKTEGGVVKFILLENIGCGVIKKDVTPEEQKTALDLILG